MPTNPNPPIDNHLKRCPWCGGEPVLVRQAVKEFYVECQNEKCKVAPQVKATVSARADAAAIWNKRTKPDV